MFKDFISISKLDTSCIYISNWSSWKSFKKFNWT